MYQDLQPNIEFVNQYDPEIAALMGKELARQQRNIELIASENIASPAVIAAMGTILTNKYAEGYPGKRYYGGCEYVDEVECIAIERAKQLFGAEYANVQPPLRRPGKSGGLPGPPTAGRRRRRHEPGQRRAPDPRFPG